MELGFGVIWVTKRDKKSVHEYGYRTPRFPAAFRFLLSIGGPTPRIVDARCVDVSEQGLAAQLTETLSVNSEVLMVFALPGDATPLRVPAKVISQQGALHGFSFLFSSQAERDRVHMILSHLCSHGPESSRTLPE